MRKTKYVRTTIAEPFPVAGKPDDKAGPFYAPNSEWFVPFTAGNLLWKEASAKVLRDDYGYTVTVDVVER